MRGRCVLDLRTLCDFATPEPGGSEVEFATPVASRLTADTRRLRPDAPERVETGSKPVQAASMSGSSPPIANG